MNDYEEIKAWKAAGWITRQQYSILFAREWRTRNRDHVKEFNDNRKDYNKARAKVWRENHKEERRAYYEANKEHLRELIKRWDKENPERRKEIDKKHRNSSKHKEWKAKNKDRINEWNRRSYHANKTERRKKINGRRQVIRAKKLEEEKQRLADLGLSVDYRPKSLKHKFCNTTIDKIERFEERMKEPEVRWVIHHKSEIELNMTSLELRLMNLYYNRPPEELVWMRASDHSRLHNLHRCSNK